MKRATLVVAIVVVGLGCKKPRVEIGPAPDGAASSAGATGAKPETVTAERTAGWLVGDVREGKWELAYSIMSSKYRATVSLDEFTRTLKANPYFYPPKSVDIYKSGSRGATGYATGVFESGAGAYEANFSMTLEGTDWRVAGLQVGGSEVLPRFAAAAAGAK